MSLLSRLGVVCALACFPELATSAVRAAGIIEGRVQLPRSAKDTVMNQRYEVIANAGVISIDPPLAVVYLEGAFAGEDQEQVEEIRQRNYTFIPSVLPIRRGTRVEFPNDDKTYHNIFSYSPAKRFDLGRYRADERPIPSEVFDKPGLVTLRCDIHEHMRAIILVLDTPHFVLTDRDGNFRLTGLPAGEYVLKAWLNSKTTLQRTVSIPEEGAQRIDFP